MKETEQWRPAEIVAHSGSHARACGREHLWSKSTDVRGHRSPPVSYDSPGHAWTLRTQAHHDDEH
ncbi:hypothetical protein ACFWP3_39415 [Streptomyces sp. NPDC058525]|uniref:hypothetical protein n=1 Tax=Streptomyces sp. NPDC058525 TaxID=3346538 RepID=UPI00365A49D4